MSVPVKVPRTAISVGLSEQGRRFLMRESAKRREWKVMSLAEVLEHFRGRDEGIPPIELIGGDDQIINTYSSIYDDAFIEVFQTWRTDAGNHVVLFKILWDIQRGIRIDETVWSTEEILKVVARHG